MKVPVYQITGIDIPENEDGYSEMLLYDDDEKKWIYGEIIHRGTEDAAGSYRLLSPAEALMEIKRAKKAYPDCIFKKRI